jgi:hypothetical protein
MYLIGLCGLKQAGKSTVSRALSSEGLVLCAFADPIKDMLAALGLTWDDLYGADKECANEIVCGNTPRFAMQTLGTEWGRQTMGGNIWVNVMRKRLQAHKERRALGAVIEDVRFPNEVAMIREAGGVLWWVERPSALQSNAGRDEHISETSITAADCDAIIQNDGMEAELRAKAILRWRVR